MTFSQYWHEAWRYYWLKFLLSLNKLKIYLMHSFGYKVSDEELEDFEIESH